jgi:pimeloyl-ACP methyl ester carboxylesterase
VLVVVAPEDVPDSEIDAVVAEAKEAAASGALEVPDEPQPQLVEIGGRTISYFTLTAEEPGGDPVVLVHGFGGDKNSWLFVQQPLAEHHAVHALDLPGHGASDKEVGDGSLASLADTVVGFLDALGISRAHLVGHSLGGAVVAAVARAGQASRRCSPGRLLPADADAEYLRASRRSPPGGTCRWSALALRTRTGHPPAGRRPAHKRPDGRIRRCPCCSARCSTATARRSTPAGCSRRRRARDWSARRIDPPA